MQFDSLIFVSKKIGDVVAVGQFSRKNRCVYGFEIKISILVYNYYVHITTKNEYEERTSDEWLAGDRMKIYLKLKLENKLTDRIWCELKNYHIKYHYPVQNEV